MIEYDIIKKSALFIFITLLGKLATFFFFYLLAKNFGDIGTLDNPQNSIPHQVAVVSAVLAQGI